MESSTPPDPATESPIQNCRACEAPIDVTDLEPLVTVGCPNCGADVVVEGSVEDFQLEEIAGRGGMGVVYKALDLRLNRHVALKLLRRIHSDNPEQIAQLETEAAITASINHPHVVKVYSTGLEKGQFYIAMELVDRGSLDDLIRIQGRVAEAQVLEVGIHIAEGLRAAMQHGLIHRDVKPGNILFADAHTAKIVDFGLAIFMSQEESVRGEIWGTPYYVAPEKLDGKPEDFRSDIYSLGATLFHALAGRPPFEAQNASMVALKHLKSQPVSLQSFAPHVSGRTNYIINRTLLKNPALRYQSYDELIEHFRYAREELREGAAATRKTTRVVLEDDSQKKAWGLITLAMIAVIIGAGVLFVMRDRLLPGSSASPIASDSTPAFKKDSPADKARAELFGGNSGRAADQFKDLAARASQPEEANWALLQEGIARFYTGHSTGAMDAFRKLEANSAEALRNGTSKELNQFFNDTARKVLAKPPVPPGSYPEIDRTSYRMMGLLAYGLKNWQYGKLEDAVTILREFRGCRPVSTYAWIEGYKSIASKRIDDLTAFQMAVDKAKLSNGGKLDSATQAAFRRFKGPLRERAKPYLDEK